MKKFFTNEFFYAYQSIQSLPGTFEKLRKLMTDVYLHALMQVEDILSII